jgi:ABC-type uncharacterized transport system YnjBCD permease subunit
MYFCVMFILGYMRFSLSPVSHASWEFVMNGKMMLLLFYGVICVVYLYRNVDHELTRCAEALDESQSAFF